MGATPAKSGIWSESLAVSAAVVLATRDWRALAEFQCYKKSACRVSEMVFASSSTGEQVEMLAGMLEVLLDWFRPPRPGPVTAAPGCKCASQDTESLIEVDSLTSSARCLPSPLILPPLSLIRIVVEEERA